MIFQNYLQISKIKRNGKDERKVVVEQHKSTLGCSLEFSKT